MHDILSSIILGIVEGLTEFLPVSSTAHLLIAQELLGFDPPGEVFPIVIQLGAILAVVAVYWRRFWDVLVTLPSSKESRRFALGIVIACIPAAIVGAGLHDVIKRVFFAPGVAPKIIAATLILGGIIILIFERIAPAPRFLDGNKLPLVKAFQIGLFQVLAVVPGVSRSGATILGGEMVGIDRKAGALFTFYLAVPTMLGATVLDLWKNRHVLNLHAGLDIAIGFVVAFVVALFVVRGFIAFIGRYGLKPFGWYRIAAGLAIVAVLVLR
ncbi:MAG TPA: undecaprenyl-diphosphate phosphatase [Rhizomicrobium sp.]|jgi:undecaprenyl-diphosphatase|nr:undecaprenyl-diphosphate phosphatase [Rhizomicrobium sp.]